LNEKKSKENNVIHVKHWPEGDHPRERLLDKGPGALSDAALLSIILGAGRQGKDALGLAREMLAEFGGFSGLMSVSRDDLLRIQGIGKAKIAQIQASMEIVRRQLRSHLTRLDLIENPDEFHEYLKNSLGRLKKEEFRIFYLNRSKHQISGEVLLRGSIDMSAVHPRQVAESALGKKASALILAHNHLTDLPLADDDDIALTRALVKACWSVEIPILDHLVIGRNSFLSMKKHFPEIFEGENDIA
jgi:DNA repair protein RadC